MGAVRVTVPNIGLFAAAVGSGDWFGVVSADAAAVFGSGASVTVAEAGVPMVTLVSTAGPSVKGKVVAG